MLRLIWLHLRYFLTKNNLIVLSLVILLYTILGIYASKFYIDCNKQILYNQLYQEEYTYIMFTIYKLIVILFSSYIFSLIKSSSYFVLLNITKIKFYFTKVVSNFIIILFLTFLMLIIYFVFSLITFWYMFDINIITKFLTISLQGMIIGLISSNLCYLVKTNFAFIIVFFLYIIFDNGIEFNIFSQIINVIFPTNIEGEYVILKYFLIMNLYFLSGFCLFKRQEIY